jgi:hypothetical protein
MESEVHLLREMVKAREAETKTKEMEIKRK